MTTLFGILFGYALIPHPIGMLAGGVVASLLDDDLEEEKMRKKRVFVSFDYENDKKLKDFIVGQSRLSDSPFEVADYSLKEAAPEHNWETKARNAINRSEIVIVMVGPRTYCASGVLKEVEMARKANIRIVQVIGYKNGDYKPVPNAGRLYSWSWPNLKNLLA